MKRSAWHGTTFDFNSFSLDRSRHISYFGPGVYLSSSKDDARFNYCGYGPDTKNKIDCAFDDLIDHYSYETIVKNPDKHARKQAFKKHAGGYFILCKCVVSIKKPFEFPTRISPQLFEELQCLFEYHGLSTEKLEELYYDEIIIRSLDFIDWNWEEINEENIFQEALINLGYDGVLMHNPSMFRLNHISENTKHYVAFNPEQVKIVRKERFNRNQCV